MKKLLFFAFLAWSFIASAQPVDPDYYHRKQYGANWLFEYDTVRINDLRIDNKLAIDSLGRLWWYDNSAATLGKLLIGNGTYYSPLAIGSAGEVLTVSGGTASWEPATIGAGGVTGLTADLFTFGAVDGSLDQDPEGYYDAATNYLRLGDPGGGDPGNPGRISLVDGTNIASGSAQTGWYFSKAGVGAMTMAGDKLEFQDPGGDLFTISRATWSADMNLIFPAALPTANQELYAATVVGDDVTLAWRTGLTAEVDGSTTNEIQDLSYDAANREVDISLGGTSATIPLGLDDGATEGLASFTAADFNVTAGNVAIDYANGQAATSGQDGLLQSADWTTFNNKGYTLTLTGSQGSFVDGTPYYSGAITTGTSTTAAINQVPIPVSGTITAVYVYQLTAGTLATGESSTLAIRVNNTTDVTVSSAVLNSSISSTWSATGLSQAVSAGDYIELKFTAASWATNPTNVRWTAIVFIK